jgi:hypothetical protein
LPFGGGSGVQAPLEERRIVLHEIKRDEELGAEKHTEVGSCLPVLNCSGWNKQQEAHHDREREKAKPGSCK